MWILNYLNSLAPNLRKFHLERINVTFCYEFLKKSPILGRYNLAGVHIIYRDVISITSAVVA